MTLSFLTGAGIGILALMFLPVLIALLRRRLGVALVAFVFVIASIFALAAPIVGMLVWLAALCIGAFAGARKVIVIERRP